MTTATELVSAPSATPSYDIVRAAYAELRVTDLASSERFYVDLLGMVVAERTSDALYLRGWEERLRPLARVCVRRRSRLPRAWASGYDASRTSTSSPPISRRKG